MINFLQNSSLDEGKGIKNFTYVEYSFLNKGILIFFFLFLGHLSHSGDLLLWVGVRRRASSVVRRPLTSSSQELLGQS